MERIARIPHRPDLRVGAYEGGAPPAMEHAQARRRRILDHRRHGPWLSRRFPRLWRGAQRFRRDQRRIAGRAPHRAILGDRFVMATVVYLDLPRFLEAGKAQGANATISPSID